ncbi:hypothetical protein TNCV_2757031 [Trichonephila clavipes]|nr:hypothetical protein TNCV_2757031 [Trichonephila clavipes]
MERSYLFFSSGSLVARTYDVSNEEKFRFPRSHLFAGVCGISNLYTGGIFDDGFQPLHRRNFHAEFKPLHRLNEVFEKWRRVSSTDGFCSLSKL